MEKTKIYISGPITGVAGADQVFDQAEKLLQAKGYDVVNPMKLKHDHNNSWQNYMKVDIKALCDCDAIYMLNNWYYSRGASLEFYIATQLGLNIIDDGN